jgi:hypothetical protein
MANRYWVLGSGSWGDTAHWSDSDGGVGGFSVPTSADDVYFNAASFSSNAQVVVLDVVANCLSLDFTGIDQTMTLSSSVNSINIYGDLTLAVNLTWTFTGTAYVYMKAVDSRNITSNGVVLTCNKLYFDGVGGTWTNQDEWVYNSWTLLVNGHWNTNNKTIRNPNGYFETSTGIKTLSLGTSIFIMQRWRNTSPINFIFNYNTSTVELNSSDINAEISGTNTFYNLKLVGLNNVNCGFEIKGNTIVNNIYTAIGYSAVLRLIVFSSILGTQRTITVPSANVVASNVDFRDITFTNPVDLSAITGGSGDCGGNSNITFTTAQPQFFKHTSGAVSWSNSAKWFTATNGGGVAGRVPLPQDDVWFDANSFAGVSTLTVDCPRIGRSLDMSGVAYAVTMTIANGCFNTKDGLSVPKIGVSPITSSAVSLALNTYTICYRMKINSLVKGQSIFYSEVRPFVFDSNKIMVYDTGYYDYSPIIFQPVGTWNTFIVTVDGSTKIHSFYINGILAGTYTAKTNISNAAFTQIAGDSGYGLAKLNLEIKEFRGYNRVLSPKEIKNWHNSFVKQPYIVIDFSDFAVGETI